MYARMYEYEVTLSVVYKIILRKEASCELDRLGGLTLKPRKLRGSSPASKCGSLSFIFYPSAGGLTKKKKKAKPCSIFHSECNHLFPLPHTADNIITSNQFR